MRILMVSWEYPPLIYGGLGRHVHGLAEGLAAAGHNVVVVTQAGPTTTNDTMTGGVRVVRVLPDPPARSMTDDFLTWVLALNTALGRAGEAVARSFRPDVVHAHDWVSAHAGVGVAHAIGAPLVATVHATEAGLWNGWLSTPLSRARHDVEGWLAAEAARVIVCSAAMQVEVSAAFDLAADTLDVIPNAVDVATWRTSAEQQRVLRHRLGIADDAPLLVVAGRLEWEKGGDVAIEALARVRRQHSSARLVIAGAGSQEPAWRALARRRRVARAVTLCGHLDDRDLPALLATADVALVPSSYEPFGMVALEAAAAGTPVVAGDTGGLREVVEDGGTGLLVPPRDPAAIATATLRLLDDPELGARLLAAARSQLTERFSWPVVARATTHVYAAAGLDPRPPRPRPAPVPDGNVLAGRPRSVRDAWRDVRSGPPP
ncbi:MAG TPA: glycosyltransferase family 4 protein [Jiangellaceae bacterium]|nr:glycosyltransferase family 4 protein [Jiangellaceae bacterium]